MKKINYKIFIITLSVLSVYFFTANFVCNVSAESLHTELNSKLFNVGLSANYNPVSAGRSQDIILAFFIGQIISYILSILGVIFLCLLVYGGFLWMLAKGDSEEVNKSKDIMTNAIIGIIIVLVSYAITYYVVSNLASATMTTGSGFAP